jgi:hypothetical protein
MAVDECEEKAARRGMSLNEHAMLVGGIILDIFDVKDLI